MDKVILSIIMPVYNVISYLDRSINSVLNQTFQNFELIIVDDGSTDGCSAKVDEYAKSNSRIKVIHQSNAGVSAARNAALKIIQGEYLTFLDPDDFYSNDAIEDNINYLINHNDIDILQYPYCNYYDEQHPSKVIMHKSVCFEGYHDIFMAWWSGIPIEYTIWNKIFRSSLWQNVSFIVGHVSEDTSLAATFCQKSKKVYISEKGIYYYQRGREDSYTYHYSFDTHIDLFNAHNTIYQLFRLYPDMISEKVLAFTRLFRRLIQAKQECPSSIVNEQMDIIRREFPSYHEIFESKNTEKFWLISAKILGVRLFMTLFLSYLKRK